MAYSISLKSAPSATISMGCSGGQGRCGQSRRFAADAAADQADEDHGGGAEQRPGGALQLVGGEAEPLLEGERRRM